MSGDDDGVRSTVPGKDLFTQCYCGISALFATGTSTVKRLGTTS